MTRQRPTFAPGSCARRVRFGAFSTCESIQTPSLSVRGGLWFQKPLHSISPKALASGAKRVSPEDFQSLYSMSSHSLRVELLVVAVEDDVAGLFESGGLDVTHEVDQPFVGSQHVLTGPT